MKPSTRLKAKPSPKATTAQLEFEAIGTHWCIDLSAAPSDLPKITQAIKERIAQFDGRYSRFRPDSWINKVSSQPGTHEVPSDFEPLFRFYEYMYQQTNGAVTPLIGEVMERAGYDQNYSLVPKTLHRPPKLPDTLHYDNTLHVKYKCHVDFGAAGKGYLVDIISDLLKKSEVGEFLVDAGGDMYHFPASPTFVTSVGLEDPNDPQKAVGIVKLARGALCGSAGNRRKWANFHHIISPHTLKSVDTISATWVVADSAMIADGLATCLFFVDSEDLDTTYAFEYLVLKADNTIRVSPNFPGEVFYETHR